MPVKQRTIIEEREDKYERFQTESLITFFVPGLYAIRHPVVGLVLCPLPVEAK